MDKYKNKVLCKECKSNYHPKEFPTCWNCYSKTPSKVLKKYEEDIDNDDRGVPSLLDEI